MKVLSIKLGIIKKSFKKPEDCANPLSTEVYNNSNNNNNNNNQNNNNNDSYDFAQSPILKKRKEEKEDVLIETNLGLTPIQSLKLFDNPSFPSPSRHFLIPKTHPILFRNLDKGPSPKSSPQSQSSKIVSQKSEDLQDQIISPTNGEVLDDQTSQSSDSCAAIAVPAFTLPTKVDRYLFSSQESEPKLIASFNKNTLGTRLLMRSKRNFLHVSSKEIASAPKGRQTRGVKLPDFAQRIRVNAPRKQSPPKDKDVKDKDTDSKHKESNKEKRISLSSPNFGHNMEDFLKYYGQYDQMVTEPPLIPIEDLEKMFEGQEDDEETDKKMYQKHKNEIISVFKQRARGENLGFRNSAIYILTRSERLLNTEQITHRALKWGLLKTVKFFCPYPEGRTPHATMSARMNTDINKQGNGSIFRKFGLGKFSIRTKFSSHIADKILTDFEKEHGMTLLKGSALKYVTHDKELDWLDIKESQIPNSGFGLFAKNPIQAGTVFCEYIGIIRDNEGGDIDLYPYGISVTMGDGSNKMIDGIDETGKVLSNAPRANDAGPKLANCGYSEYSEHPGRVFLEAIRDIAAGEEIFVTYGPSYWGCRQYPDINRPEQAGQLLKYSKRYEKKAKALQKKKQALSNNNNNNNNNNDNNNNINITTENKHPELNVSHNSLEEDDDFEIDERLLMIDENSMTNDAEQKPSSPTSLNLPSHSHVASHVNSTQAVLKLQDISLPQPPQPILPSNLNIKKNKNETNKNNNDITKNKNGNSDKNNESENTSNNSNSNETEKKNNTNNNNSVKTSLLPSPRKRTSVAAAKRTGSRQPHLKSAEDRISGTTRAKEQVPLQALDPKDDKTMPKGEIEKSDFATRIVQTEKNDKSAQKAKPTQGVTTNTSEKANRARLSQSELTKQKFNQMSTTNSLGSSLENKDKVNMSAENLRKLASPKQSVLATYAKKAFLPGMNSKENSPLKSSYDAPSSTQKNQSQNKPSPPQTSKNTLPPSSEKGK